MLGTIRIAVCIGTGTFTYQRIWIIDHALKDRLNNSSALIMDNRGNRRDCLTKAFNRSRPGTRDYRGDCHINGISEGPVGSGGVVAGGIAIGVNDLPFAGWRGWRGNDEYRKDRAATGVGDGCRGCGYNSL